MLPVVLAFVVLAGVGVVLAVLGQQVIAWVLAAFASGMAGVITAEWLRRASPDPGGDADPGGGGDRAVADRGVRELPDADGGGSGADGDVGGGGDGGAVHGGRAAHRRIYAAIVFGWRRR